MEGFIKNDLSHFLGLDFSGKNFSCAKLSVHKPPYTNTPRSMGKPKYPPEEEVRKQFDRSCVVHVYMRIFRSKTRVLRGAY